MPRVFSKGGSVKIQDMNSELKKVMVWDWSIRVFHWLFAVSIMLALGIALLAGEHSPLFRWHMIFGLIAGFMLVLRVVLLMVGTKHIRIQSFLHAVSLLPGYIRGLSNRVESGFAGHNPLAWVVYMVMFALLGGVVASGVNMRSEWAEEGHSLMAWLLLVTIVAHMVGLVMHTIRYRESIAFSMMTGRKKAQDEEGIESSGIALGVIVLATGLLFAGQLIAGYDSAAGMVRVPWINAVVQLGESDDHEESEKHKESRHRERDHEGHRSQHHD